MAIFPDIETGRKALIKLLKGPSYCDLRLEELSDKYDEENKAEHRRMLKSISKLDLTKKIKDLTPRSLKGFGLLTPALGNHFKQSLAQAFDGFLY